LSTAGPNHRVARPGAQATLGPAGEIPYPRNMTSRAPAPRIGKAGVLALAVMAGCATNPQPLDAARLRATLPKNLLLVLTPNAYFSGAPSKGPGMALPLVVAVMNAEEAQEDAERAFVVDNALADPSLVLGNRLAHGLAAEYGLSVQVFTRTPVPPRPGPRARAAWESVDASPPPLVAEVLPAADLVLEVRTTDWGFDARYKDRAGLRYEVEATFSDARSKKIVAQGTCLDEDPRVVASRVARSPKAAAEQLAGVPTYRDMVELSARRTAEELERARDRCERKLRAEVLALAPPAPPASQPPVVASPEPSPSNAVAPGQEPPASPAKQQAGNEQP
jgi:hypothetical protein